MMESGQFTDYYQLLGVPTNSESEQIREAFLRLAKEHHPDRGGSTEFMQQLTRAYRTLMSTNARRKYDLLHDFNTGNTVTKSIATDDEIDDFIDQVFREYQAEASHKPKKSLLKRLADYL